jgi:glycerophosphoryl diester phosphodiesterase
VPTVFKQIKKSLKEIYDLGSPLLKYYRRKMQERKQRMIKCKKNIFIEAHRGAGRLVFENTLKAFEKACELNLDGVELDVWKTLDNVPVVFHGGD